MPVRCRSCSRSAFSRAHSLRRRQDSCRSATETLRNTFGRSACQLVGSDNTHPHGPLLSGTPIASPGITAAKQPSKRHEKKARQRSPSPAQPMRYRRLPTAILLALTAALSAACHRSTIQTASTPTSWPEEEHCWWAPLRTAVSPDSVALLYARAYATLRLSGAVWTHQADTAWAEAGPTVLSRPEGSGLYAARVVAYRRGDTTFVRPFVAVRPDDGVNAGHLSIPFCGDAIRTARAGTTAPSAEEPDESLPVWRRRPRR